MTKYKSFMDTSRTHETCTILLTIATTYSSKIELSFNFLIKSRNIFIHINTIKKKY